MSIGTDIEERKKYEEQIKNLAYYDSLTKLPNRFKFEREITKYIKKKNKGFMIAYMDIDNFKNINDSIGHQAGDIFLKYFAETLVEQVEKMPLWQDLAEMNLPFYMIVIPGLRFWIRLRIFLHTPIGYGPIITDSSIYQSVSV